MFIEFLDPCLRRDDGEETGDDGEEAGMTN